MKLERLVTYIVKKIKIVLICDFFCVKKNKIAKYFRHAVLFGVYFSTSPTRDISISDLKPNPDGEFKPRLNSRLDKSYF